MDRKLLYFLHFFLLVALVAAFEEQWEAHKKKYKLKYDNDAEEQYRKEIFKKTDDIIEAHKKSEYNQYYKLAHNKFSTMTREEKTKYKGHRRRHQKSSKNATSQKTASVRMLSSDSLSLAELRQIQQPVDYSKDPCMTPPKDQGQCGSCWAFVSTAVLEFNSCVKSGKKVELSQQQLIDCLDFDGCNGGNQERGWTHVAAIGGQVSSASYPYISLGGYPCKFNPANVEATISTSNPVTYVQPNDIKAIMSLLAKKQIVSVSVSSLPDSFNSYKNGVFTGPCPPPTPTSGHAMIIVGFGSTIVGSRNVDYWVIRNSWGPNWGMGGYGYFERGVNRCDIESRGIMTTTASTGEVTPGTGHKFNWQSASNGQVMMSTCSYWGDDGAKVPYGVGSGDDCGGICAATTKCTHFSWWANECSLKMPGNTNNTVLSVADPVKNTTAGQCGYVVNRKSVGLWTTNGQFQVASDCTFSVNGGIRWPNSNVNQCMTYCLQSSCNFFTVNNGTCYAMTADRSMNPIPISSSKSTCGYLSSRVTIAPNGPTFASPRPIPTMPPNIDDKFKITSNCKFVMPMGGAWSVASPVDLAKCKSICLSQSCLYFTFSGPNCTMLRPNNGKITTSVTTDSVCGQSSIH